MKIQRALSAFSVAAALSLGFLPSANATPILVGSSVSYQLDVLNSSGTKSATPYATIKLTQRNGAIDFLVSPTNGYLFANTNGPHFEFTFNLSTEFNNATVLLTGANAGDFIVQTGSSFNQVPFGTFGHAIDFSDSIRNGLSAQYNTPLSFTVSMDGLNAENFIQNNLGYRFAADLGMQSNGQTQNVASSEGGGGGANGNVPEPATMALFGIGLLAVGALRRKA